LAASLVKKITDPIQSEIQSLGPMFEGAEVAVRLGYARNTRKIELHLRWLR
jgi:hypothetical protein